MALELLKTDAFPAPQGLGWAEGKSSRHLVGRVQKHLSRTRAETRRAGPTRAGTPPSSMLETAAEKAVRHQELLHRAFPRVACTATPLWCTPTDKLPKALFLCVVSEQSAAPLTHTLARPPLPGDTGAH